MHEIVLDTEKNHVLVALLPSPKDLAIARTEGWYRIPAHKAPVLIREGRATHIAFYQPKDFGDERYLIRWYSPITSAVIRKRIEVLPNEPLNPNAQTDYYIIGCADMQQLAQPIPSVRPRRVVFFPTTLKKLFTATDINHLFNDSPLETLLWNELVKSGIPCERQFDVRVNERWFKLDFAIFCKVLNLDIECDGDSYHMDPEAVRKDKWRRNLLATKNWQVLPFTTSHLKDNMTGSVNMVHDAINRYGGLADHHADGGYRYTAGPDDPRPRLFD